MDESLFASLKKDELHNVYEFRLNFVKQHIIAELIKRQFVFSVFLPEFGCVSKHSPYAAFSDIARMSYYKNPNCTPFNDVSSDFNLCGAIFILGFAPAASGANFYEGVNEFYERRKLLPYHVFWPQIIKNTLNYFPLEEGPCERQTWDNTLS